MIKARPFETVRENRIQIFIEILVSAYLYILLCLTDYNL